MNIFEKIRSFITGRVSDEEFDREIATGNYEQCPLCGMHVHHDVLADNGYKCPECKSSIPQGE